MSANSFAESQNPVLQNNFENFTKIFAQERFYRNKTVAITGATGYIGSMLTKTLLCVNRKRQLGMQILALVRNTEKAKAVFGDLSERKDLEIIRCDWLTDSLNIKRKPDVIFHTAGITASAVMISNPVETIAVSIEGTREVLAFAKETEAESVVYLSSMEMYGDMEEKQAADEEELGKLRLLEARSSYPESKRLCECLCAAYASEYGVNVKIARLAQTFGSGIAKEENRVFAQFAKSVPENKDIILHTDGSSDGNYVYIFDVLEALLLLAEKGNAGEAYNVSNEKNHLTIREMAEIVARDIAKEKIRVIYDIPEDNRYGYAKPVRLKLLTDKIKALGWKPKKSVKEMYEDLINYLICENQMDKR